MVDRSNLKVYVDYVDAVYGQAVDAGAVPIMTPADAFWGDRYSMVKNPLPLSDEVLDSFTCLRGFLDRVVDLSGKRNPTVREFLQHSGRGTLSELP